ncbi:MAG: hypothetical protein HY362_00955 [Candidatus Aenigmarchaeota archaeon]|nr:hypothetical protein [Candidatus Aenigmarchaeota archaeon]
MENDIVKVSPDIERAKSIIAMAAAREENLKTIDRKRFTSLVLEGYYEIIKELITALLLIDGFKTLSHKKLVEYLGNNYKTHFKRSELDLIDMLRVIRNRITYEGFFAEEHFLIRREKDIKDIIEKLRTLLNKNL